MQQVNRRGRRACPEARKRQRLCARRRFEEGHPLGPALIDTIAVWICQGAENN
jgi:hypothetical protein